MEKSIDKILYLGPNGSYTELATKKFLQYVSKDCVYEPMDSIYKIINLLKDFKGDSLSAVIPIENSIEGVVRETQDNLFKIVKNGYRILAETRLPIEHCLISFGDKSNIKTIKSHPQALAQCREYIFSNITNDVVLEPVYSTSKAVESLKFSNPNTAAIGSFYCAELYNIPIIEKNINDENNNTTRFVLLSKIKPIKHDFNKISIVFSTENKAGALNKVLNILEKYELNMSYIDSRPSRKQLGEYLFYIDFGGHIEDTNVVFALQEIQSYVSYIEILSEGANCVV